MGGALELILDNRVGGAYNWTSVGGAHNWTSAGGISCLLEPRSAAHVVEEEAGLLIVAAV